MAKQKTIKEEISYKGIGLHTGNTTCIKFKPAPENFGIEFVRVDLDGKPRIKADIENVIGTVRGTTIGKGDARVHTIEHLMAALCAMGIDNIEIEIDANEPPVGDGSAMPFVEILKKAGIVEQSAEREYIEIKEIIEYSHNHSNLIVIPSNDFKISCTVSYNHPVLGTEFCSFSMDEKYFEAEIASARTFCFDYEIEALQREGLAKGGSLDNAIVIGEKKIHNDKLRFSDEFVRHKVLDLIGDLYILGKPIKGHVIATRCGHGSNIALAKKIKEYAKGLGNVDGNGVDNDRLVDPKGRELGVNEIKATIPHRYPFLLLDRVIVTEEERKAVGFKNMTINEEFFQGHFPERPVMPGVLIVEALAQTSAILFLSRPDLQDKLAFFMAIDGVKFRKPVVPGDVLRLEIEVMRFRGRGGKVEGKAYVKGALVAEAEFMFSLVDK